MKQLLDVYYRLLQVLITVLMFVLIIPVSMQIFSRYTGGLIPRYIWTEEIARFCFIWIVMIGAMIAVRDGTHVDVDVLPHAVSPRVEGAFCLFVHFAMLRRAAVLGDRGSADAHHLHRLAARRCDHGAVPAREVHRGRAHF